MGEARGLSRAARASIGALGAGFFLLAAAALLQRRDAVIDASAVRNSSLVVLLAGAADANDRLEALHALCTDRSQPLPVLVGDDDELDDDTGRAWGPVLVDRISEANGACLAPVLVPGRVRTTAEELDALDAFLGTHEDLASAEATIVFVTSPFHRARVALGAASRPHIAARTRQFLWMHTRRRDYSPLVVGPELLRIVRDGLGLSDLLGRRTLDRLRALTPWPRPSGAR